MRRVVRPATMADGPGGAPAFPAVRLRRLRRTPALRRLVQESWVTPAQLVLPLFVKEGARRPEAIPSMPGVVRHTVASVVVAARRAQAVGLGAVLLFGLPRRKDARGGAADAPEGIIPQAVRRSSARPQTLW